MDMSMMRKSQIKERAGKNGIKKKKRKRRKEAYKI